MKLQGMRERLHARTACSERDEDVFFISVPVRICSNSRKSNKINIYVMFNANIILFLHASSYYRLYVQTL
jgi:hypothetical protein